MYAHASRQMKSVVAVLLLLHLLLPGVLVRAGEVEYRIVIESDDPAPGMPDGSTIANVSRAVLNDHGHVAFLARVALAGGESTTVLYAQHDTGFQPVTMTGDILPGAASETTVIDEIMINNNGEVAFRAFSGSNSRVGIWTDAGGALRNVMIEGVVPPGPFDSNETWDATVDSPAFVFNDLGQVAFAATVAASGRLPVGLWFNDQSGTSLIAVESGPAPAVANSTMVSISQIRAVSLNDIGEISFQATYTPNDQNVYPPAIWTGSPSAPQISHAQCDLAPGTARLFTNFAQGTVLTNSGVLAFSGILTESDCDGSVPNPTGIWAGPLGAPQLLLRDGDDVPGLPSGATIGYTYQSNLALNGAGRLATWNTLDSPAPSPVSCVLWETDQGMEALVCDGDPIPGGGGVAFRDHGVPVFNAAGQLAALGAADASFSPDVLYIADADGVLHLIAMEDEEIELGPGDIRLITNYIGWESRQISGLEDGRPASFNEAGEAAFVGRFGGDSSVIVARLVPACPGDADGDGATTVSDFFALSGNFGTLSGATRADGDLNGDGAVNVSDFFILSGDFGCPDN